MPQCSVGLLGATKALASSAQEPHSVSLHPAGWARTFRVQRLALLTQNLHRPPREIAVLGRGYSFSTHAWAWRQSVHLMRGQRAAVAGIMSEAEQRRGRSRTMPPGSPYARRTLETLARDMAKHHRMLHRDEFSWPAFWAQLLLWPPDVFAFTSLALQHSGAYIRVVSPPDGITFPPRRWAAGIAAVAEAWRLATDDPSYTMADERWEVALATWTGGIAANADLELSELCDDRHWMVTRCLLGLHAAADQACYGIGLPGGDGAFADALQRLVGADAPGNLSNFSSDLIRVLPNFRTPQCGMTLRSLSFHLTAVQGEVRVRWQTLEPRHQPEDSLRILLIPEPTRVSANDFRQVTPPHTLDDRAFGFFEFAPSDDVNLAFRVADLVRAATTEHGRVDLVVLPEQALSEAQIDECEVELFKLDEPPLLLAGVRGTGLNFARMAKPCERRFDQAKHHRWFLDDDQIERYSLRGVFPRGRKWWEHTRLGQRELHFILINQWLLLCPLICEDLARQEPVANVVRAVGPNLVIALLLDGPQLTNRWAARYASVLADDPGSSVLSVTSIGMALASRPPDDSPPSRVVALWKDPVNGIRQMELEPGHDGVVITLGVKWGTEWTADGRSAGQCANLVWRSSHQVKLPPAYQMG